MTLRICEKFSKNKGENLETLMQYIYMTLSSMPTSSNSKAITISLIDEPTCGAGLLRWVVPPHDGVSVVEGTPLEQERLIEVHGRQGGEMCDCVEVAEVCGRYKSNRVTTQ